jgi:hypothetical protein
MPFTTNVVSSNPAHGEVYSIQHYVIKFVGGLGQVGGLRQVGGLGQVSGFLWYSGFL